MSIGNINVEKAIKNVEMLMEKEKMSPAFKAALQVILLLIKILLQRLGINSKNSSTPPSQDPNRIKKIKEKNLNKKKQGGQPGRVSNPLKAVDNPDEISVQELLIIVLRKHLINLNGLKILYK